MEVDFCVEALEAALTRHGKPKIFNTVQGNQQGGTTSRAALFNRKIHRQRSERTMLSRRLWL
jgi:putative transposase